MSKLATILGLLLLSTASLTAAKYKVLELPSRPASEYQAKQDFQGLLIAADAYTTQEKIQTLFDTDKLFKMRIMPVLVVVENKNDFPIRILGRDIYLVDTYGTQNPPLELEDVLLEISLNKPMSGYSSPKDILVQRSVKPEMLSDFEHKAFLEKLIPPQGSDQGVVFFRLPEGDDLLGWQLYLPEVINLAASEGLMFFEFPIQPTPGS